jgi:hypothetical protein
MGVDVEFKARTTGQLPEPVATLAARFREAMPFEYEVGGQRYPDLTWDEYDPIPTLEVHTLMRYYGPGYERGHWPSIRAMGDWLAEALDGVSEVRYGGDSADEWEELTPWAEARAECETCWDRFGNEPYQAAMRR